MKQRYLTLHIRVKFLTSYAQFTQRKTLESPSLAVLPFTEKSKLVPMVAYKGRIRITRLRTPATLHLGNNPVIHCPLNKGREGPR